MSTDLHIRGAAAKATQCIGCTHQHRVPDLIGRADSVADRVAAGALGDLFATGFDDLRTTCSAWRRQMRTFSNDDGKKIGKDWKNM